MSIITGDCRIELPKLPAASVQCVVTSPPYWALRDYGVDGQIGLEESPRAFVDEMVGVFREVWRVLRDDGTLWLNLGDSYAQSGRGPEGKTSTLEGSRRNQGACRAVSVNRSRLVEGMKRKDLCGIPWRVALALQDDGWTLRSDIIWAKPNPMPEPVLDRPTRSHEYVFLLAKGRRYYYDGAAVREPRTSDEDANGFRGGAYVGGATFDNAAGGKRARAGNTKRTLRNERGGIGGDSRGHLAYGVPWVDSDGKRNRRDVWTIGSIPFKDAHFATMPVELARICVRAGCPVGGVVLDPFFGAGTTGVACVEQGRDFIGIELNPTYTEMAHRRIARAPREQLTLEKSK